MRDGVIATVAGSGRPASAATATARRSPPLNQPAGVAALPDGGFLIADTGNNRIRRVSPSGIITTVAGTGSAALTGDGGPATSAALNAPAASRRSPAAAS